MQTDVETLIIHTDLTDSLNKLNDIKGELRLARLGLTINNIGYADERKRKVGILGDILSSLHDDVENEISRLETLFETHKTDEKRQTRAFEFLGDMLSGITGVPSARDHRVLLEQIRMLRLDNEGVKDLMLSRNSQQSKIIETMTQQDSRIGRLDERLRSTEKFVLNHARDDLQLASVLALQEKAHQALRQTNSMYFKLHDILMLGDHDHLSRFGISKKELGLVLDRITLRRTEGAPVYGRKEIEQYYRLQLSHSWTIPDLHEIVTLIQIPIAPMHSRLGLKLLDHDNIMTSDLTMAIIDNQANTYRYLSLSDFHRCTELRGKLICQKRPIQILPPLGCSIRLQNCEIWATTVVHDITNSNFLFISKQNETQITSSCGKQDPKTYILPSSAMVTIPLACSVSSDQFTIGASAYTKITDLKIDEDYLNLSIHIDAAVLANTPLKNLTDNIDNNRDNLTNLRRLNDKFADDLERQRQRNDANWADIQSGHNSWYELINWALLLVCMTACILLCLWLAKVTCNTWTIKANQKRERGLQDGVTGELLDRITALETTSALLSARMRRNSQ